jgi:hypothetical protein
MNGRQIAVNLDATPLSERTDQVNAVARHLGQVERFVLHALLPGIEARQFEQRFHQPPHLLGAAEAPENNLKETIDSRA